MICIKNNYENNISEISVENIIYSAITRKEYSGDKKELPRIIHKHNYNEVFACFKGTVNICTETEIITINENEIVVVPSNISHNSYIKGEETEWLAFGYFIKKNKNSYTEDFFNLFSVVSDKPIKLENQREICRSIFEIFDKENNLKLYALKQCGIVYSICSRIKNNAKGESAVDSTTNILAKIDSIINERYNENITLKELSDEFYLSEKQISRIIYKVYRKNFNEILSDKRIKAAMFLIKNTNKKIYEISEIVGFSSPKSFYREFKKRYKNSPNLYR